MTTARYEPKNETEAIIIEERNKSSLEHTTCSLEHGQLGRNI